MKNINIPDDKITKLIFTALEDGWEVKQIKNSNSKNSITINNKMYEFTKQNNKINIFKFNHNTTILKYYQKLVDRCKYTN